MTQSLPSLTIGMLLFPQFTLLDLVGPYDVFTRMPDAEVQLVALSSEAVSTDKGMLITPHVSFEQAPAFDLLFIPGGFGQQLVMEDQRYLDFIRQQASTVRWLTSVCTGSLILGVAGLLQGYRATTHWRYLDLLELLGAQPIAERVVVDRNRITGAGVSTGIDLALMITAIIYGEEVAKSIQLSIEYDPQPPFQGGSPTSADPNILKQVSAGLDQVYRKRREQIERIVKTKGVED